MAKIKYDSSLLFSMSLFEKITHAPLKDCFIDDNDTLCFIVPETQLGKAIGKKGINVKLLSDKLKRRIRIYEYSNNLNLFVKNLLYPIKVNEIKEENNIIYIKDQSVSNKSMIIGRNAKNLRNTEKIIKRYFPNIKEVKVL